MRIDVHIDHLMLDGVKLTRRERAELPGVIQRELSILLRHAPADRARQAGFHPSGGARPDLGPASERIADIGRNVAIAVSGALPPGLPQRAERR